MVIKKEANIIKIVFYAAMVFALLYLVGYGLISDNSPFRYVVFNLGNDSFTDFWDCVRDNIGNDPYAHSSSYPALACIFFGFFARQLQTIDGVVSTDANINQMMFVAYSLVLVSIFISLLNKRKRGESFEKTVFAIMMLLSAPFIYMFERGNIISLALIFLMAYVFGKDSKNKWIREISYVCLGISAALKIYPAVFGLLLIKDKNYKAAVKVIIYGIAFFIIPFFAYHGIHDMKLMYGNMRMTGEIFQSTGVGGKVNIVPTLRVVLGLCGIDEIGYYIAGIFKILPYAYLLAAVIACMFHKSNWKVMTLLSSMIVLVPDFSFVYTLVFFIIPLISFLDSKEKRTFVDWICLACFIAIMIPIVHNPPELLAKFQAGFSYLFSTFIQGIAVLIMSIVLVTEGFVYGAIRLRRKNKQTKQC